MDDNMAIALSGKELAAAIKQDASRRILELKNKFGITPSLALILIGSNKDSKKYVELKAKQCRDAGASANIHQFSERISPRELSKKIVELNKDQKVHGILVQLPIPELLNDVLDIINVEKDADGLTSSSLGRIMQGREGNTPAGAEAIVELLSSNKIDTMNRHIVVVGSSNILGKPLASLLSNRGAAVTLLPPYGKNIAEYTKTADIIVVDIGRPKSLTGDMISQGSVIIDAGNNYLDGKLVGDVDFESVNGIAHAITPVPGGVGPMLVAVLIRNLVKAAERQVKRTN